MSRKIPLRLNKELTKKLFNDVENFLFDCDGVIWNWPKPLDGAVESLNMLKSLGKRCFFVTNNSTKTRKAIVNQFNSIGVMNVTENDIVCTAWVLGEYLKSIGFKDKCYVIGNPSMAKELDEAGIQHTGVGPTTEAFPDPLNYDFKKNLTLDPTVKCVAVGYDHYFSYPKLLIGTSYAFRPDNIFIGTNEDSQFPSESTTIVVPGAGSFVSALRTSAGREPLILGKPHKPMWDVLKLTHNLDESRSCMVGDRLETDIAFGANCGIRYTLAVLSGITNESEILSYANQDANGNSKEHLVPHFYTNSLKDLLEFSEF